jgi:hypothetical protein
MKVTGRTHPLIRKRYSHDLIHPNTEFLLVVVIGDTWHQKRVCCTYFLPTTDNSDGNYLMW